MDSVVFHKNDDFVKIPWANYGIRKSDIVSIFTRGLQVVVQMWDFYEGQKKEIIGTFSDVEAAEEAFRQLWEAMCL